MSDPVQTCARCGHQVHFTAVGSCTCKQTFFPGGRVYPRDAITRPSSITCTRERGVFTLRWRWSNRAGIYAAVLAFVAGVVLSVFGGIVMGVLAGGAGMYWGLGQYLNSTWVRIEDGWLRVSNGPLRYGPSFSARTSDIRQLYVYPERKIGPANSTGFSRSNSLVFHLVARLGADDRRPKVVPSLSEPEVALFMERELERELGIRDEPVELELRR